MTAGCRTDRAVPSAPQSDLDNAQDESNQNKEAAATVASSSQAAYKDFQQDLGTTSADLAETEQDLKDAEKPPQRQSRMRPRPRKRPTRPKTRATRPRPRLIKPRPKPKRPTPRRESWRAAPRPTGVLFEGESVKDQVPVVKKDLQGISDD